MDSGYHITTDRKEIMDWAKERGGEPACFLETDEAEVEPRLRINFANDEMDERIQEMTWERFFEELDNRKLAFKYKNINEDGRSSQYCEFISRSE